MAIEEKEQRKREREEKKAKREEERKKKAEEKARKANERAEMKAKKAKDKGKGKGKQPRRTQRTVSKGCDGPGPSREPLHGSEESGEPAAKKPRREVHPTNSADSDIDENVCCMCFGSYYDDVFDQSDRDWINCACSRWLHEVC